MSADFHHLMPAFQLNFGMGAVQDIEVPNLSLTRRKWRTPASYHGSCPTPPGKGGGAERGSVIRALEYASMQHTDAVLVHGEMPQNPLASTALRARPHPAVGLQLALGTDQRSSNSVVPRRIGSKQG